MPTDPPRTGTGFKLCSSCGEALPLTSYYSHRGHESGVQSACKSCVKAKNKARYHARYSKNLEFRARARRYHSKYYAENGERSRLRNRQNHRLNREKCIAHYGGKCACCGEDRFEFLAIDHTNGDGNRHRKEIGCKGNGFYRLLIRRGYPNDPPLRILCHNCNMAIGFYGYCPHQPAATSSTPPAPLS